MTHRQPHPRQGFPRATSAALPALLAAMLAATVTLADEPLSPQDPIAPAVVSLAIYPEQVTLHHVGDTQRLVAVATRSDGVTVDVTDQAEWRVDGADPGERDGNTPIRFAGDRVHSRGKGLSRVGARFADLAAEVDVQSLSGEPAGPVSYRHDVIPIFLHAGCNSGGCHGSSRGKDGFGLSLFGYDPAGDYQRLTREQINRRINLALPDDSLLLTKSIAAAPHTGGKRFSRDSRYYETLRRWIEAGAPNDLEGAPTVTGVRIYPPAAALESPGNGTGDGAAEGPAAPPASRQRFVVVADYSDGRSRDVTDLAVFLSSNESSAAINGEGVVTAGRRGEAFVMARFDTHTVGSQVLSLPAGARYTPPADPPAGEVDTLIEKKLATMRISPSPLCGDEAFLRRATIDIAGRLPTADERAAFLADGDADKRAQLVDRLLEDPAFASIWAAKWADLLLVRTEQNRVDYKAMHLYSRWLREKIAGGTPLDEMVRELLSATGTTFDTPATNFYQIEPDPKKIAENVAQSMLGLRVQCAQCHNHPFDRWTMDDYYAFTAFFAQIGRKRTDDYREYVVFNRAGGESRHPVGNRVMAPKFLGGAEPFNTGDEQADAAARKADRRAVVAEWVTSPDNPYFATSVANRVWAHFFGVGVVEPVDDIRVSNPPSNPELFELLGEKLVAYDYDLRRLVRDIVTSNAYQRSSTPNASNADDTRNFARCTPRRLPAETLLDCLSQSTDAPEKLPGLPLGAKAVEIAGVGGGNYFLKTFGKAPRASVCACEADTQPTLSQTLHLINGSTTNRKIQQGGLVKRWLDQGKTPAEVVDAIYQRCLGRLPTDDEHARYRELIGEAERPVAELEDVFWAVLNSREFVFNH